MTKNGLKVGYVVVRRDGSERMIMPTQEKLVMVGDGDTWLGLEWYSDDLKYLGYIERGKQDSFDIMKVYGFSEYANDTRHVMTDDRPLLWKRDEEIAPCESELNKLTQEIHDNAKAHGWWDEERSFGEIVALCHSELSEALEEYRNGMPMAYFNNEEGELVTDLDKWDGEKLEGIATEMIDCVIRILDWCGKEGIDVEKVLKTKHEYNKTRPYMHGGKKI